MPENAFKQKKKKPRLKFNPRLALISQLDPDVCTFLKLVWTDLSMP